MRKIRNCFITIFIMLLFLCTACQPADVPKATAGEQKETGSEVEPTEETTEGILVVQTEPSMTDSMETEPEISVDVEPPILSLGIGTGEGQVAYGYTYMYGHTGPEAFAVEDGTMFILDNHNKRVILWEDRGFSDFDISDCPYAQHMTYQKGKIAVIDPVTMVTGIYSVDGTRLALIQYADHYAFDLQFPVEVTEIGDTYLVWKSSEGYSHRYDWAKASFLSVVSALWREDSEDEIRITDRESGNEWRIDAENKLLGIERVVDGELFYSQYDMVTDADHFVFEHSIRKIDREGSETYTMIDSTNWYATSTHPVYVSSEGVVYLMECLQDGIVISEVKLEPTEVAKGIQ